MRWSHRAPAEADATPEWRQPVVYRSPGLQAALAGLGGEAPCRVLDLGPTVAANFEFVARFARHLTIVDLPATEEIDSGGSSEQPEICREPMSAVLPSIRGPFDLVLMWDLINYLESERVRSLAEETFRLCRREARLLALVVTGDEMPWRPRVFEIVDDDHLAYNTVTPLKRPGPKLTPAAVERLLEGFEIDRSYVLRHGIQEFVAIRR